MKILQQSFFILCECPVLCRRVFGCGSAHRESTQGLTADHASVPAMHRKNTNPHLKTTHRLDDAKVLGFQSGEIDAEVFTVKGISCGDNIRDVISTFGLPYGTLYYNYGDSGEFFNIYYIDQRNYTDLSFSFDPDTGEVYSICLYTIDPPADY